MKRRYVILTKSLILICMLWTNKGYSQTPAPTIPEFVFYNFDKTPFTNANLSIGKPILFIFFDVTCDHCQHAIKALNARIGECKKMNIEVLAPEINESFHGFTVIPGANKIRFGLAAI